MTGGLGPRYWSALTRSRRYLLTVTPRAAALLFAFSHSASPIRTDREGRVPPLGGRPRLGLGRCISRKHCGQISADQPAKATVLDSSQVGHCAVITHRSRPSIFSFRLSTKIASIIASPSIVSGYSSTQARFAEGVAAAAAGLRALSRLRAARRRACNQAPTRGAAKA